MDEKDKLENLIISYLLGELDEQQQAAVLHRIMHDEKSRQLYDDLRKTVKLIIIKNTAENVDLDKEWNAFEETKLLKEHPRLFGNEAERFGNGIIRELDLKRKTKRLKIVSAAAVAASFLLMVGWGLSLLNHQPAKRMAATTTRTKIESKERMPVTRCLFNQSATAKQYLLEDGTEVQLSAGSKLIFKEPFDQDRRDIRLDGSAYFSVAKNKAKPFTVFSAGISVTALGTRFTVTAFKQADLIRVELHEGKVVVKGTDELKYKIKKDYFLMPGQEFIYGKSKQAVLTEEDHVAAQPVQHGVELHKVAPTNVLIDKPSMPSFGKGSWFMFNNQSLGHVFEQLTRMYKTEIIYNREQVSKMYFIGTFKQTDSLETVLQQIAATNDLTIRKEQQKFVVTK